MRISDSSSEKTDICSLKAARAVMAYLVGLRNRAISIAADDDNRGGAGERCKAYQAILVELSRAAFLTHYGNCGIDQINAAAPELDAAVRILEFAGRGTDLMARKEEVARHYLTVCAWLEPWHFEIIELGKRLETRGTLPARVVSCFVSSCGKAKGLRRGVACLCFPLSEHTDETTG
jgi:hypothetical protein